MSRGLVTFSTWNEVPYFLQPRGRWSLTGFLMTFNNFCGPSAAWMLYLCNSWTMSPQNLSNVRGILVWGLISIKTFFSVCISAWKYFSDHPYKKKRWQVWSFLSCSLCWAACRPWPRKEDPSRIGAMATPRDPTGNSARLKRLPETHPSAWPGLVQCVCMAPWPWFCYSKVGDIAGTMWTLSAEQKLKWFDFVLYSGFLHSESHDWN